jgi:hypothetical protein
MKTTALVALLAGLTTAGATLITAQQTPPPGGEAAAIRALRWRGIGPANPGGRISVVAGLPGNPDTFYVAGAAGGIIKTTNGGTTWTPLFDDQPVASIGAIAIAPSNENVLWVGTGEGDPRNSTSFGNGVYRSADGGRSWTHLGLADTERIKRIAVHPSNPELAYVCALGHAWGPNDQRGVFRTTDGGKTWQKVLYRNTTTGCSDIAIRRTRRRSMRGCTRTCAGRGASTAAAARRRSTNRSTAATRGRSSRAASPPKRWTGPAWPWRCPTRTSCT